MKFYPSSSAFMLGDVVVTKYNSGCLRSILLRSRGVRDGEVAQISQDVGRVAEELHEAELWGEGLKYEREVPLTATLWNDVAYSGRADFVVDTVAGTEVHEIKGHTSKNTRRDVIKKGIFNVTYLAQLVSYMFRVKTTEGKLVCGYFEEGENGAIIRVDSRTFEVEIDDDGDVYVDDEPTGYNVSDLLAHQRAACFVISTGEIGPRPANWNQKYDSPCTYCPFKAACDAHDKLPFPSTDEFVWAAENAMLEKEMKPAPKIHKVKVKKGKSK